MLRRIAVDTVAVLYILFFFICSYLTAVSQKLRA